MAAAQLILLAGLFASTVAFASPAIEWVEKSAAGEVRVCGLPAAGLGAIDPEALGRILSVRAVDSEAEAKEGAEALPELWGSFAIEADCLIFRPRHQPSPGMALLAAFRGEAFDRLNGGAGTPSLELRVAIPSPERQTRLLEIYPSGEEIPENLLRLYVTFSAPMSIKGIEKHVHLKDASGAEIDTAFVEIPDGLWDPGRRRLTLFLHPGRVKSGITVGEVMGKVVEPGETITLEIDAEARDAQGAPLLEGGRRSWRIGPAQRTAMGAAWFRLAVPPGEGAALEVESAVALDRALALSAFTVQHQGRELEGGWELEPGERRLQFRPAAPWRRGDHYVLRISEVLEDVAGNRLGRAFEVPRDSAAEASAAEILFVP